MTDKTGGAAFPHPHQHGVLPASTGMTLRDWFAGQALAGLLSALPKDLPKFEAGHLAILAYDAADALLTARDAE